MKKLYLALILSLFGFMSLEAATVSVLVVEAGLPSDNGCSLSAEIWESGMMDAFFDAGHIVSNAPCQQITAFSYDTSNPLPSELNGEFDQARIGGADFFVFVVLHYMDGNYDNPKEVIIRVFRVSSGELLYETRASGKVWENSEEEFFNVKQSAAKIVPQLSKKG